VVCASGIQTRLSDDCRRWPASCRAKVTIASGLGDRAPRLGQRGIECRAVPRLYGGVCEDSDVTAARCVNSHSHHSARGSRREGDGQGNRRLVPFFLPFSEQTEREARRVCPEVCPDGVPTARSMPRIQGSLVVAISVNGDGLNGDRFDRLAVERFRVSIFVSYTCRCAVRWPRG